ncbi:MAG: ATP-dependent Clp protease proteolytic subunit [Phycisphaerae bacterium]|nr:ATP-dependent Clp protease proteolytic subunit [Phycisphaerae bacterium]
MNMGSRELAPWNDGPIRGFFSIPRLVAVLCLLLVGALSRGPVASASDAKTAPPASAIPAARAAKNLAVITIRGEIDAVTAHSVKRRIEQAIDAGADGLVIEIHSPGGLVVSGLEICSAVKQAPVNTIAWINTEAYSMAAIIALACDSIVLAPHATLGDAAPIQINMNPMAPGGLGLQTLGATERQKLMAPMIAEVVESARLNGYDENLVQAFITLGVETWLIREKSTGKQYFVTESEYRAIFGEEPHRGASHIRSGVFSSRDANAAPPADERHAGASPSEDPSAFRSAFGPLNSDAEKDIRLRLDGTVSPRPIFSAADRDRYELIEYATDGQTLLTLKESDLRRYGLADATATIQNDQDLQAYVGAAHLTRLDQSWSEDLVAFMTQGISGTVIKGLLIVVFLMAMFIEMSMPGVGLPGIIALAALAGLVVPPMLIGAANWWMGAMVVGGLVLILLEIFVLPGFGVPGVIGLLMLFGGLVGSFASPGQLFPGVGPGGVGELARAGSVVLLSLFVAGAGVFLFVKYTHKFPIVGRLVLADRPVSSDDEESLLAAMNPTPTSRSLPPVGAIGRTTTVLRPSGTAEINDRLVDVVSEFGFIDAGKLVRVTSVTDYRVGVDLVREPPAPPSSNPSRES